MQQHTEICFQLFIKMAGAFQFQASIVKQCKGDNISRNCVWTLY